MKTFHKTLIKALAGASLLCAAGLVQAEVKELRIIASGGTSAESIKEAYIKPFTERTGIKVSIESPTSLGKLQAMVTSGQVDNVLVELGATNVSQARALDQIEDLDWDLIDPEPMFPEARLDDAFGYQYFSTILSWAKGTEPMESWEDFWNVEDFPGKRSLPDYPGYTLPLALMADGVKPDELYPLDIERAFNSLEKIKDHVAVWWQAGAQAPQLLEDGEVKYAASWSGRVTDNPELEHNYNEGLLQLAYFVVPKGAPADLKEAAMGLLHEMSKASNQSIAIDIIPYTGASPDIDEELPADKIHLYPTTEENRKVQTLGDPDWTAENAKEIERRWQEFKLGL